MSNNNPTNPTGAPLVQPSCSSSSFPTINFSTMMNAPIPSALTNTPGPIPQQQQLKSSSTILFEKKLSFWSTLPEFISNYFTTQPYECIYNNKDTSDMIIQVFNSEQQLVVEYYVHQLIMSVHSAFLSRLLHEEQNSITEQLNNLSLQNNNQKSISITIKDGKPVLPIFNIDNFRNVERILKLIYAQSDCNYVLQEMTQFEDWEEMNRIRKEWQLLPKYFLSILVLLLLWNKQNLKMFQPQNAVRMMVLLVEIKKETQSIPLEQMDEATSIIQSSITSIFEKLVSVLEQQASVIIQSRRILFWSKSFVYYELLPWMKEQEQTISNSQMQTLLFLLLQWSKLFFSQVAYTTDMKETKEELQLEFLKCVFENVFGVIEMKNQGLVFFKGLLQQLVQEPSLDKQQKEKMVAKCYENLLQDFAC